jgi:hypothetical protein
MTTNKMLGQVWEMLNQNSDDSIIDTRLILDIIEQNRAVDLRNEYSRLRSIHPSVKQVFCVDMELADSYTCCDGLLTGCSVLKSVSKIPDTIELHYKDGLISVKPADLFAKPLTHINIERVPTVGHDSIGESMIYSFMFKGYLYAFSRIPRKMLINKLEITAVFSNPIQAGELSCDNSHCFGYDDPYPITEWMWQSLTMPKTIDVLRRKFFTPFDNTNNGKEGEIAQPNQQRSKSNEE